MMFVHLHLLALTATGRDVRVMLAIVTFSGNDYFLPSIVLTSTATSDCMLVTSAMG